MHPRISVLIPTYRYARYLPEALESVLRQQGADFEVLVSDDASDDGSADIIRACAARDPRIRFTLQPRNLGMVANWNACLRDARGDYVQFLFGDDRLNSSGALRTLADLLDAHPAAAAASCARELIGPGSAPLGLRNDLGADRYWPGPELISRCLAREANLIGEPSAVMFRRNLGVRGFDPQLSQFVDLELWLHLLEQGGLAHTDRPLAAFRLHPAQATAANAQTHAASVDFLILLSRYHAHFRGSGYRRRLFRQLYYARKGDVTSPAATAAASDLHRRLTRRWYWTLWAGHRLTKPFRNLGRRFSAGSAR